MVGTVMYSSLLETTSEVIVVIDSDDCAQQNGFNFVVTKGSCCGSWLAIAELKQVYCNFKVVI